MNRSFKIAVFAVSLLLAIANPSIAQIDTNAKHTEVTMRMIGHELLLSSNDSTSRVLPISGSGNMYKISFESKFAFTPDSLASIVDRVMLKSGISSNYIVEMRSCESDDVVYSYEIGSTPDSTLFPCAMRSYPEDCYTLLITLLNTHNSNKAITAAASGPSDANSSLSANILWIGLILLLVAISVYFLRKRRNPIIDPNIINLGKYHFDKLNSELLFENQRIELSGKEADLLILLYDTVNTTVEREVILKLIWGDNGDYIGRTLDVFVSKLRKKLESDPRVKIVNVRGVGYKLVMDGRR